MGESNTKKEIGTIIVVIIVCTLLWHKLAPKHFIFYLTTFLILVLGSVLWLTWRARILVATAKWMFKQYRAIASKITKEGKEKKNKYLSIAKELDRSVKQTLLRTSMLFGFVVIVGAFMSVVVTECFALKLGKAHSFLLLSLSIFIVLLSISWLVPPFWLLKDVGLRHYNLKDQTIVSIGDRLVLTLRPLLGLGAIAGFFLLFYRSGYAYSITFLFFIGTLLQFFPALFLTTFLYRYFAEEKIIALVKKSLRELCIKDVKDVTESLEKTTR
jgi:hypothetical protein